MRKHGLVLVSSLVSLVALGALACSDDGTLGGATTPPPQNANNNGNGDGTGTTQTLPDGGTVTVLPIEEVSGEIAANRTLGANKRWLLKGLVSVKPSATLTIEKGTTIMGDNASKAILLVEAGAKIQAVGTADDPIVFTSQAKEGEKRAGDWGGIVILGKAPVNVAAPNVEGILKNGSGSSTTYGGTDENDSSGALQYVRIEYSGILLSQDNEVNGITFAGVGRGTKVDHVQVRHTLDDCFEFFGGTVDAKYLACQHNEDDGFDFDLGYRGRLQFLVLQQDPDHVGEDNGVESDNDDKGSAAEPFTNPTVYNMTLCGKNANVDQLQYGMLIRRNSRGTYRNVIISGFEASLDFRDTVTTDGAAPLTLESSLVWSSTGQGIAEHIGYVENEDLPDGLSADDQKKFKAKPTYNDDKGMDEVAYFKDAARKNLVADPQVSGCFNATAPVFGPASALTEGAAAPPNDGFFDASATYRGAFKDANDGWATSGKWAVWSDK